MAIQANVLSAEGMLSAAKDIVSVQKSVKQEVQTRLESAEKKLRDAKTELNISEGMLTAARAVEAGTAAALAAASARVARAGAAEAAAVSTGNPIAIAAASAELAAATAEEVKAIDAHKKAVEHRKRLEERVRLAKKCVEIAESNLKVLRTALLSLEKVFDATGIQGINRLRTAYEDLRKYNSELQPFLTLVPAIIPQGHDSTYLDDPSSNGISNYKSTAENDFVGNTTSSGDDSSPETESSETRQYYDDNGNLYRVGNHLQPNATYTVNGYTYQTDDHGRITSASGTLRVKDREGRMPIRDSLEDIGKGDEKSTDDRGHLIGDQFDGSNGLENMIPQDATINRVMYKNFENQLAKLVKEGKTVMVTVEPSYTGDSHRPDGIWVTYTVDGGEEEVVFFPNDTEAAT